jgi:hypothetical protein
MNKHRPRSKQQSLHTQRGLHAGRMKARRHNTGLTPQTSLQREQPQRRPREPWQELRRSSWSAVRGVKFQFADEVLLSLDIGFANGFSSSDGKVVCHAPVKRKSEKSEDVVMQLPVRMYGWADSGSLRGEAHVLFFSRLSDVWLSEEVESSAL